MGSIHFTPKMVWFKVIVPMGEILHHKEISTKNSMGLQLLQSEAPLV